MKPRRLSMRLGDVLVLLLLTVAALGVTWAGVQAPSGGVATVSVSGEDRIVLSLTAVDTVEVEGPLGKTRLATDGEGVRILESPCPNHHCIRMGRAKQDGQALICVPNEVLITVEGASEGPTIDAVTG